MTTRKKPQSKVSNPARKGILTTLGVVGTVLGIVGGMIALDQHYQPKAIAALEHHAIESKIESTEQLFAGALERQQLRADIDFFRTRIMVLDLQIQELQMRLEDNPNSTRLQDYLREMKNQRRLMQQKLDQLLNESV